MLASSFKPSMLQTHWPSNYDLTTDIWLLYIPCQKTFYTIMNLQLNKEVENLMLAKPGQSRSSTRQNSNCRTPEIGEAILVVESELKMNGI